MTIFKMNALAAVLAMAGMITTSAATEASYSDCSSTLPLVTQEAGVSTSDGIVLSTWSVCTVVHQTNCDVSTVTGSQEPSTDPTGSTFIPGESAPSSYKEGEHGSSTYRSEAEPSQQAPEQSAPTGGSQPTNVPVGSGQPSTSGVAPSGATDVPGDQSSNYPEPTDEEAGPSHSQSGINPSASESEASTSGPSGASGTPPTTTAISAASMHDSVFVVMLSAVGVVGAIIL